MKVIHWKSLITGYCGHGEPMKDADVKAWLEHLKNSPNIIHWLVDVKDGNARN